MHVPSIAIFISYARNKPDTDFVDRLEDDLQKQGYRVWVDRRKLEGGQHFLDEIQHAIDSCQVLLVVLSDEAIASSYVKMEYRYAQDEHKVVIPLQHRPISEKIPISLRGLQHIDFESSYAQGLKDLLAALRSPGLPPSASIVKVSYFYAREDERLCREFETHLALLQQYLRQQGINVDWHRDMVTPGMGREQIIDSHLNTADIILPLISPDFMASGFSHGTEMKQALVRHGHKDTKILPIMLRQVFWQGTPFSHLEVLPTGGSMVGHSLRYRRDKAFSNVIEGIYYAIIDFHAQKQPRMEKQGIIQSREVGHLLLPVPSPVHPWIHPPLASRLPSIIQIGLIVLVILFVVGSGLGSFVAIRNYNNQLAQSNLTATAHAGFPNTSADPTSTVTAALTQPSTALANPTATTHPQPTGTLDPSLSKSYPPTYANLQVNDSLSNATPGWSNDVQSGCQFMAGAYHVRYQKGSSICYYSTPYNDFVYEIQMVFVKSASQGDTCGGIVFREEDASLYAPGLDTHYAFVICTSGSCGLAIGGLNVPLGNSLYNTSTCPGIHTNVGQANLIAVVAKGPSIYLFLNKVPVTQLTDNSSGGGLMGVTLNAATAEGEVAFNDAKVWTLP